MHRYGFTVSQLPSWLLEHNKSIEILTLILNKKVGGPDCGGILETLQQLKDPRGHYTFIAIHRDSTTEERQVAVTYVDDSEELIEYGRQFMGSELMFAYDNEVQEYVDFKVTVEIAAD